MEDILLSEFSASLSKDESCKKARSYLKTIRSTPGLIPLLVKISLEVSHIEEIRKAAVIYLKNLCRNWKGSNSKYSIPQSDKDFLKFSILPYLSLSIPEIIRCEFEDIAKILAEADYPWDKVTSQILAGIDDPNLIYATLNMIYQISRKYEYSFYKKIRKQEQFFDLVAGIFPNILEIMKSLVSFTNIENFSYVELILKIYWITFNHGLKPPQTDAEVLDEWMTCFKIILEYPMGDLQKRPVSKESEEIQEKMPQWICKNWAVQIIEMLFDKYCNLVYHNENKSFVEEYFQKTWAVNFFKVIIQQVFQIKEKFIPCLVLNSCLKFISKSVNFSPTFRLFDKNSISHLIVNVILPILYREKSDEELWKNNPIEYIGKEAYFEYSLKGSAINLLLNFCRKDLFLKFFKFLARELKQSTDLLRKEVILLVLGSLSDQTQYTIPTVEMETILTDFVFPELTSQIGFLRSRAVWVYSRFSYLLLRKCSFTDCGMKAVCKLLTDPELPVRYEAALALIELLDYRKLENRQFPELKILMEIYLKLLDEVYSEKVFTLLEKIITIFNEEIFPFITELTIHISRTFTPMMGKILRISKTTG